METITNLRDVAQRLPPRPSIVLHSAFAEPALLTEMLVREAPLFAGATLYTLMPMGDGAYARCSHFEVHTFLPGAALRKAVNDGHARLDPVPLSTIPGLFENGKLPVDLVLLQLSAPDGDGNMSLGISVDHMPAVLARKPLVVAQINPAMPFTFGNTLVKPKHIDFAIEGDGLVTVMPPSRIDAIDRAIARNVARLLSDGVTIQYGIGAVPEAVMHEIGHLRDIGIHTGYFSDEIVPLIEEGVVSNQRKEIDAGKTVSALAGGSAEFYRYLHRNRKISFRPTSYTHNQATLSRLTSFFAINSALQVDLTGAVNAEVIGNRIISGPGGLPDFAEAGAKSKAGASIIALRSTSRRGDKSTIVAQVDKATLKPGNVTHVVTEYGIAEIAGRDDDDIRAALTAIAHPVFRRELSRSNPCAGF